MKKTRANIGMIQFVLFFSASTAVAGIEPAECAPIAPDDSIALVIENEDEGTAVQVDEASELARARVIETTMRDYDRALGIYAALAGRSADEAVIDQAELGQARCLVKLGSYADASALLLSMQKRELSDPVRQAVLDLLATTQRLGREDRAESASSVDNLVWQLLEAAAGENKDRASSAVKEIEGMGTLAFPVLKEATLDRDYYRSVAAFKILVRIDEAEVVSFLETCAVSSDPALRKRCLDGLEGSLRPSGGAFGLLLHYFRDKEKTLQIAALKCFDGFMLRNFCDNLEGGGLAPYIHIILELHASGDEDVKEHAYWAASRIVNQECRNPTGEKAVSKLSAIASRRLDSFWPLRDLSYNEMKDLKIALWMAMELGKLFDRQDLLNRVVRFWPERDLTKPESQDQVDGSVCDATSLLDAPSMELLVKGILDSGDSFVINRFGYCCPFNSFAKLSEESRCRFMDAWGRSKKPIGYSPGGREQAILGSNAKWRPAVWGAFVRSVLENEDYEMRVNSLASLGSCPDPRNPACYEAISLWACHDDDMTRDAALGLVRQMVELGKMDAGSSGALGVIDRHLATIEGPITYAMDKRGVIVTPDSVAVDLLFVGRRILDHDLAALGEWVLDQKIPGWHDTVVALHRRGFPLDEILRTDPRFVGRMWPYLSARGKELLFSRFCQIFRSTFDTSKPVWIVPLLKELEFSPEWDEANSEHLSKLLFDLSDPALEDLVKELAAAVLDAPHVHRKNTVWYLSRMFRSVAPRSRTLLEIIPQFHETIDTEKVGAKLVLADIMLSNAETLKRTLEWLNEEHPESFKMAVINAFHDRDFLNTYRLKEINLDAALKAVWEKLGRKTAAWLLASVLNQRRIVDACPSFLVSVLEDKKTDRALRHLAAAGCLSHGVDESVDAVLAYLQEIGPGEGDGPIVSEGDIPGVVAERMDALYKVIFKTDLNSGFYSFNAPQRQRLCLGILTMPREHPRLRSQAALYALRTPIDPQSRDNLFENTVNFMLSNSKPGEENHEKAKHLLALALGGGEDEYIVGECESEAIEIAAQNRLENLLPLVGQVAVHHADDRIRREAVACLGVFMNRDAVPFLMECLKDPWEKVSADAQACLTRIHWYEEQKKVWQAFLEGEEEGAAGSPTAALVAMLDTDDAEVRLLTIKSLGTLGESSALPVLLKIMTEGDPDEREAARAAVEAINAKK